MADFFGFDKSCGKFAQQRKQTSKGPSIFSTLSSQTLHVFFSFSTETLRKIRNKSEFCFT